VCYCDNSKELGFLVTNKQEEALTTESTLRSCFAPIPYFNNNHVKKRDKRRGEEIPNGKCSSRCIWLSISNEVSASKTPWRNAEPFGNHFKITFKWKSIWEKLKAQLVGISFELLAFGQMLKLIFFFFSKISSLILQISYFVLIIIFLNAKIMLKKSNLYKC